MSEAHQAVARRFFEEVYNRGNLALVATSLPLLSVANTRCKGRPEYFTQ